MEGIKGLIIPVQAIKGIIAAERTITGRMDIAGIGGGGEGGDSGIPLNPTPEVIFRNDGITPTGWVATDGTPLTFYGGTYQFDDDCLVCNGSKQAILRPNSSYMVWGIKCSVNSDFVPSSDSRWWMASCVIGQELSGTQCDYGCVVTKDGYFGLGWSTQNITPSSVYALDGNIHEIFMLATETYIALIIDGQVECMEFIRMSAGQMGQVGIFWNSANNNSIIKGRVYSIGCWNYNIDKMKFSGIPKLE